METTGIIGVILGIMEKKIETTEIIGVIWDCIRVLLG